MICQVCKKNEATIHLTEIVNDKMVELHVCEGCAKEKSVELAPPMAFNDILSGLADFTGQIKNETINVVCPYCKMTFEQFREKGRLGCAQCYDSFQDELAPLIKNVQGTTHHIGKRPADLDESKQIELEIKQLSNKLKQLVKDEEFEEAVQVRDKIRTLETRLKTKQASDGSSKKK
jgi:protein arginine kinase activator